MLAKSLQLQTFKALFRSKLMESISNSNLYSIPGKEHITRYVFLQDLLHTTLKILLLLNKSEVFITFLAS